MSQSDNPRRPRAFTLDPAPSSEPVAKPAEDLAPKPPRTSAPKPDRSSALPPTAKSTTDTAFAPATTPAPATAQPKGNKPRRPQAFRPDNPAVSAPRFDPPPQLPDYVAGGTKDDSTINAGNQTATTSSNRTAEHDAEQGSFATYQPQIAGMKHGMRWGAILLSALASLMMLATSVWFMSYVSAALERDDWIGWTGFGLLCIAGLAAIAIIIREIIGLRRLRQLHEFRAQVDKAINEQDLKAERRCLRRLKALYKGRADMIWALARFRDHEAAVTDAGDLLTLAERDLIAPLDDRAQVAITVAAKRVSLVTAISPAAILDILFVLATNLSLLRQIATLYGARPGFLGGLRLTKMVMTHIIATGGLAMTDDLFGQVLGQDLIRRLSRRLGEGVVNGALTARIGIAAIEILRPLPYIERSPIRLRELIPIIFRKSGTPTPSTTDPSRS